jgi:hypothetical protein
VHDYYRIADVREGTTRAHQARLRAPWWRTLPDAPSRWNGRLAGPVRVLEPETTPDPATWRDEVALDFPSLQDSAERMCQSFLAAERAEPRRFVTLDLDARHTLRARRVPLRVALPVCCARCGGRGEAWGDPCTACDGDGLRDEPRYVLLRVPKNVRDGARLRYRLEGAHTPTVIIDARVRIR